MRVLLNKAGSEEYVVDELCALSFVCWLWPAAMDKELATQPPYPNYSTLAPRWWSPPAGGPLPTGGARRPADEAGRGAL